MELYYYAQNKSQIIIEQFLKTSAKNNSEQDFEFAYFDHVDDALIDGLEQNQDFFTLLLQNDEIKREVLGLFLSDTYNSLWNGEESSGGLVYQYENPKPMMVAEEPVPYGTMEDHF